MLAVIMPRGTTEAMAASATGINAIAQLRGRPVAHQARDVDRRQLFRGCRSVARGAFSQLRGTGTGPVSSSVPGFLRPWTGV
jgi:hypothetical protein